MSSVAPRGSMVAAEHYLVLNDPGADPERIEAALRWIEQTEANRAAYQHVARFMRACDDIAEALPVDDISEELGNADSDKVRWRLAEAWRLAGAWRIAASVVAALMGLSLIMIGMDSYFAHPDDPQVQLRYATTVGEVRSVDLPDGSSVLLGGASAVSISFASDRRDVALTDGQAFFKVARDASRPFIVSAGAGSIRAVGTQFDVHRTPRGVRVSVAEGTVHVDSGPRVAALQAGMQVSYSRDGRMAAITAVDPSAIPDWRGGTLRFRSQPLSLVVADLNRYSSRPIVIGSPDLATEEITGTVRVERILEWLSGLAAASDITLETGAEGAVILTSKGGRQPMTSAQRGGTRL